MVRLDRPGELSVRGRSAIARLPPQDRRDPLEPLSATWSHDLIAVPGLACLYDLDGRRIDATVHRRHGLPVRRVPERIDPPSDPVRVHDPVVYGGHLPKHFGHFLLESLARTWVYPHLQPGPLPFVHFRDRFHLHEEDLLGAVLAPSGAVPMGIAGPTRFDAVLIPEQGMDLGSAYAPEMRAVFDTIRDVIVGGTPQPDDTPVYLSRTRLPADRRATLGEVALERRLQAAGVRIVHPQEQPLREQIALISRARTVIGLHGTALHLTILRDIDGARTVALNPRLPHPPQQHVDLLRGSEHVHLHVQYPLHPRLLGVRGGRALEIGRYRNLVLPRSAARRVLRLL